MTILDDIAQALDKMADKYERDAARAETYERTVRIGGTAKGIRLAIDVVREIERLATSVLVVDQLRRRGNTYRYRAKALFCQLQHMRHADDFTPEEEEQIRERLAQYEASKNDPYAVIGIMRVSLDGLQADRVRAARMVNLLQRSTPFMVTNDYTTPEESDALSALLAEIETLLKEAHG